MARVNGIEVIHRVGPYGIAITPPGLLDNLVTYQPEGTCTNGVNYQWDDAVLAFGYESTGADMSYNDGGTNLVAKSSVQEAHGTQSLRLQKTTSDSCRATFFTDTYPMPTGVCGFWLYAVSVGADSRFLELDGYNDYICRMDLTTGLSLSIRANPSSPVSETIATLTADTWYYVQVRWDNPNALVQARLYDDSGATLATTTELGAEVGNEVLNDITLGATPATSDRFDLYVDDLTAHRGYAFRAPYQVDARDIPTFASFASTIAQALTATLSFTSAQTRKASRTLTAALSFTSAQTRKASRALTATLSFTGGLVKKVPQALTAALSFTSAQTRKVSSALTATLSFTSAQTRLVKGALTATLSFTSAQTRKVPQALTATLSFTGELAKKASQALTATLSFTGELAKKVPQALTAALSFTGSVIGRIAITQAFTATLSFAGGLFTRRRRSAVVRDGGFIAYSVKRGFKRRIGRR